ncbi:hypothetical protein J4441_03210 [Candidatus Micrarchaeota archaeon]|nr:hypothetical protein [Candidatus Micrarchaeota archaeon]
MNVNLGEYYEMKLRRLIVKGIAANKTEVLRMAVTAYERQIEEEEERLVVAKAAEEEARWKNRGRKSISFDELLRRNGIDKGKL